MPDAMVMVTGELAVFTFASETWTVIDAVVAEPTDPESTPELFMLSPEGSVPEIMDHVRGFVPPTDVNVAPHDRDTVQLIDDGPVTDSGD